eukprot:5316345-Lingulodinium_polyedra.AAC.1
MLGFPRVSAEVKAIGEGQRVYQSQPWARVNPYRISCKIQFRAAQGPVRVKIGGAVFWKTDRRQIST